MIVTKLRQNGLISSNLFNIFNNFTQLCCYFYQLLYNCIIKSQRNRTSFSGFGDQRHTNRPVTLKNLLYKEGTGNFILISMTRCCNPVRQSRSLAWTNASCISCTICLISASLTHLVVIAGVPIRSPDGRKGGLGSSGIVDLLVEIPI